MTAGGSTAGFTFPRARRLLAEAEFADVARAGPEAIRISQRWFSLTAKPVPAAEPGVAPGVLRVRFGLTVGKRLARRSVDRVLVKRVLREAARHAAPRLEQSARGGFDVVLRLKAPLPPREATTRGETKRALRADADALLQRFAERLGAAAA